MTYLSSKIDTPNLTPIGAPLVSVVMPVYQCENHLTLAIEGVLKQTYPHWELWLVDDASTDGSLRIAKSYEGLDNRIKVYQLDKNHGPAFARNVGIEKSAGRFIAFCDSDDFWLPQKLEKQVASLLQDAAAVCFSSYYKMLEDGTRTNSVVVAEPRVNYIRLLRRNWIGCSTAVYDTAKCGKVLMPEFAKRQDYALWLEIFSRGHTGLGLTTPLVHYRIRRNSVSSNKMLAAFYHWKVLRKVGRLSFFSALRFFADYACYGTKNYRIKKGRVNEC